MGKPIVDVFVNRDKSGEFVWSVRGRDELKYIQQQFYSRNEAFAFVEGLRQGFELGQRR